MIRRPGLLDLLAAGIFLAGFAAPAMAAPRMFLLAGPVNELQAQMARDIAAEIAPAADLALQVEPSLGAVDSLLRLQHETGSHLMLMPGDLITAYRQAAVHGHAKAADFAGSIRLIAPLHYESFYFVVRVGSSMTRLQDLREARINLGPLKGNTALSVNQLFQRLFGVAITDSRAAHFANEEALVHLISDKTIDAVALVAPEPAHLLAEMKSDARRYVKLLRFDPASVGSDNLLDTYVAATAHAASYPSLLGEDIPVLAVPIWLVAVGKPGVEVDRRLDALSQAWCKIAVRMKDEGKSGWRDVATALPPVPGGAIFVSFDTSELVKCMPAPIPAMVSPEKGKQ